MIINLQQFERATVYILSALSFVRLSVRPSVIRVDQSKFQQDSWAIAKKTARCAQKYGCTEKFWESSLRTRLLFQKFVMDFVSIDTKNVRTKFEVRSFTRSCDNRGYSKNLSSPCIRPRSILSQIFNWILFRWTLWIYLPNLTFVALLIPEIIGGILKIWGVPGFVHALYTPKFLIGFCSHGPSQYICQIGRS